MSNINQFKNGVPVGLHVGKYSGGGLWYSGTYNESGEPDGYWMQSKHSSHLVDG